LEGHIYAAYLKYDIILYENEDYTGMNYVFQLFFPSLLREISGQCLLDFSVEIPTRCSFVIEFIIPKFIECSTCFERHTAHHQKLLAVFAASGLYTHVVTGRCQG
jgi:hypothetical protein